MKSEPVMIYVNFYSLKSWHIIEPSLIRTMVFIRRIHSLLVCISLQDSQAVLIVLFWVNSVHYSDLHQSIIKRGIEEDAGINWWVFSLSGVWDNSLLQLYAFKMEKRIVKKKKKRKKGKVIWLDEGRVLKV